MGVENSDNATGAANQQERLDSYIAGFVDGEGSFHVAIQKNPCTRVGWQLVPEFRVSQDVSRAQVLDLIRTRIGCGSIRENHRGSNDHTMVFVIRRRRDLLERVIPFFEGNPLLSCKHQEFVTFADIVRRMEEGEHLTDGGFERLVALALQMNGGGRYRRLHRSSGSRILRDHMPGTVQHER
jgi:LAGLIDADG DNA endonuclease family protein